MFDDVYDKSSLKAVNIKVIKWKVTTKEILFPTFPTTYDLL